MTLAYAMSEALNIAPAVALGAMVAWSMPGSRHGALVGLTALAAALCALAGLACWSLGLSTDALLTPLSLALLAAFKPASGMSLGRYAFAAALCAFVASAVTLMSVIVDAVAVGDSLSELYLAWPGATAQWALWAAGLAALRRPASRSLPELLASPEATPRFWGLAWLPPAILALALDFFRPEHTETLLVNRVAPLAAIAVALFCLLMWLVCALMCSLVRQARREALALERARRAELLQSQAKSLEGRIDAARIARHDLRQHWRALGALAQAGDLDGVRAYVSGQLDATLGDAPLRLCENPALNSVAAHYVALARSLGAETDVRLKAPTSLAASEADAVVVLGNLLENATDALREQESGPKRLLVRAEQAPDGSLLVAVDNTCCASGAAPTSSGEWPSTKHPGMGLGIRSVQAAAAESDGEARFERREGMFAASVRLGPQEGAPSTASRPPLIGENLEAR